MISVSKAYGTLETLTSYTPDTIESIIWFEQIYKTDRD